MSNRPLVTWLAFVAILVAVLVTEGVLAQADQGDTGPLGVDQVQTTRLQIHKGILQIKITDTSEHPVANLSLHGMLGQSAPDKPLRPVYFQEVAPDLYETRIDRYDSEDWMTSETGSSKHPQPGSQN
jgi:hypothetical protein